MLLGPYHHSHDTVFIQFSIQKREVDIKFPSWNFLHPEIVEWDSKETEHIFDLIIG